MHCLDYFVAIPYQCNKLVACNDKTCLCSQIIITEYNLHKGVYIRASSELRSPVSEKDIAFLLSVLICTIPIDSPPPMVPYELSCDKKSLVVTF